MKQQKLRASQLDQKEPEYSQYVGDRVHVCAQLGLNKGKISVWWGVWGWGLHMFPPHQCTLSLSGLSAEFGDKVCVGGGPAILGYEQLRSCLAFVVCGVAGGLGGGARTPSAFLYAAMTALSRAVSPHQQPSILIAQPKSRSKRSILQIAGPTGAARRAPARQAGCTMSCCERRAKSGALSRPF